MAGKKKSGSSGDGGKDASPKETPSVDEMLADLEATTSLFELSGPAKKTKKAAVAAATAAPTKKKDPKIQKLLRVGKQRGQVSIGDVNDALADGEVTPKQIDQVLELLSQNEVEVIDGEGKQMQADAKSKIRSVVQAESVARSADPVRAYLRKMGSVPLLSREGEVEIAKRIEEGEREIRAVINGSPIVIEELLRVVELLLAIQIFLSVTANGTSKLRRQLRNIVIALGWNTGAKKIGGGPLERSVTWSVTHKG